MGKYAEMGGPEPESTAPETEFTDVLDELVRLGQGLQVEANAVGSILKGIQRMEDREKRLRAELAKLHPDAPILKEPEGFRLIKPD